MSAQPLTRCEFDAESLILRLDLSIPAIKKAVAPIVEKVMGIVTQIGCAEGKEFEVETALMEALANAVSHGCGDDPDKQIQICVACDEARGMLIIVRDPGGGFDPAQIPSPVQGRNIYLEHGRGIYLINQLMDEVRFEGGGTEIHMRKA